MTLLDRILHSYQIVRALCNSNKQHTLIGIIGEICAPSEFMKLCLEEVPQNGPNTLQGQPGPLTPPYAPWAIKAKLFNLE